MTLQIKDDLEVSFISRHVKGSEIWEERVEMSDCILRRRTVALVPQTWHTVGT